MLSYFLMLISIVYSQALQYEITTVPLTEVQSNTRIIGGTATTIEKYPYTVQVLYYSQLSCGGSLLTRKHVMSAAHCFVSSEDNSLISPTRYSIRAGSSVLNSGGSVHQVSVIVVHERYNNPPRDNDVAVLLLTTEVTLGANIGLATIPAQGNSFPDNSSVTIVGWGSTNAVVSTISHVLNEVEVRKVNFDTCFDRYNQLQSLTGYFFLVTRSMMCAGLLDVGGKDACQGDSGGPVIYQGVVVGITSWGYGCAEPVYPGVNARVASYTNWINSTVTRYNSGSSFGSTGAILLLTSLLVSVISSNRNYH
ncbi:hypothetical protein K1T71_013247 [Dendrolimus kikuchii]|uniref:Uncharacterized protein n=1 Tax=Dendrolimus kikuchii TaxID=765133 RepID=A0ACC1CHI1_9NEOP|nr:hypothetical protein K1T71_013247 [Dendrolimus kikuchii]